MEAAKVRTFETPDELRTPPLASVAIVSIDGVKVARLTFEPGWRWSQSIRPIVNTETCQVRHLGVLASGTLHVATADGAEYDITSGAAYVIEPGHDAWVLGQVPVVAYEFDAPVATASAATPAA
ncbi:cupin domain-containing protein [Luedemannella flava]|uniref:Cupin domain-containing protein n=1 Tax=Luedemannella flava TaxID=349316 RepID=A0ABP4XZV4_9ACTN